jgi:hypothetical protein
MSFAGLDTDQFCGLDATKALAAETNVAWLGYYLEAPSHSNAGWMGNRASLIAQGFGLCPIYVGQQTIGPGSHNVTAAQGTLDGLDCAAKMASEGFPAGSFAYLDLENGAPFGAAQSAYVSAWASAFEGAGYAPGAYCSHIMAHAVAAANPAVRIWAFNVPSVTRTVAVYPFPTPDPSLSGYSAAVMWQREQNVSISGPGFSLVVDLDTSSLADPSLPIANGVAAGLTGVVNPVAPTIQLVQPSPQPLQPIAAPVSIPQTGAVISPPVAAPPPQVPVTQVPVDQPIALPSQVVAQVSQLGTHFGALLAGVLGTAGLVAPNQESQIAAFGGSLAVLLLSIGINAGLQYYRHQQATKAVAQAKAS